MAALSDRTIYRDKEIIERYFTAGTDIASWYQKMRIEEYYEKESRKGGI